MRRMVLDQDVRSLSEFRANASAFVQQVRETKRPMVITQNGRSAAVLLDVVEYEDLLARLELLQDIYQAEAQLGKGQGVSHREAKRQILERLDK